jgi:transketolase
VIFPQPGLEYGSSEERQPVNKIGVKHMEYKNKSDLPLQCAYKEHMTDQELHDLSKQFRKDVIELTWFSGTHSSHVGGELSVAEIMAVLYGKILNLDPENPGWEDRDRVILSKGHASAITYVAMAWRGYFKRDKLWNEFNRVEGNLEEHANMRLEGIEAPTGSLGMGLSNGCGMAWCAKLRNKNDFPSYRIYIILSDGECTEGQTWEAAMLANHLKLDNLIAVVDYNKYMISGSTYEILDLEPFAEKWQAFGWHVQKVNGHDISALVRSFEMAWDPETALGKPRVIIADTLKGYPISFMMENPVNWHSGHLDEEQYRKAMEELTHD